MNDTIISLWASRIRRDLNQRALWVKQGNAFQGLTWEQIAHDVQRLSAALVSLNIQPGDRIAQVSGNCYEWLISDLAIHVVQAVHVPIHATLSGEQIVWQIMHSEARLAFVSDRHQAEKIASAGKLLPAGLKFIGYESDQLSVADHQVLRWSDVIDSEDRSQGAALLEQAVQEVDPHRLATILYTSGTTGEPKGVMLSQGNLASNACSMSAVYGMESDDLRLNFLPLSHIYARTCDFYAWIAGQGELALAENRDTVIADCRMLKPTMLNGVPHFYDRIYRHLTAQGQDLEAHHLRQMLGGRIRKCGSGGAALPDHLSDFFHHNDVPLYQGYGLTETAPVLATAMADAWKRGTVGQPLSTVEIRIADDGEIVVRGPNIMLGYWQNEKATAAVLQDGWFSTGDLGQIDNDGYLKVTGRKKELIVTAGGKNIAPVHLESLLTRDPLIQQAVVIGEGRRYLTALVVPEENMLLQAAHRRGVHRPEESSYDIPELREIIRFCIETQLAEVSQYEKIGEFSLLARPFSIEQGELTPKLSLRRHVIEQNYRSEIERMYSS